MHCGADWTSWCALACAQLEERTALVAKLQSQLDTAVRMLKSAKIVLPPQLTSPAGTPNLASARLSYAGGGVL